MPNALVPEFAVRNYKQSLAFYCDLLGFECDYARPEEGFAYLKLGGAELMIDEIGTGRTFDDGHLPTAYPFGRGVNVQIEVPEVRPLLINLEAAKYPLFLPLEEKWYRVGENEFGNHQFMVADPDGYLLRFFEDLGERPGG